MKRVVALFLILILCIAGSSASAERKLFEKKWNYIGAMQVVKCKEWVSLREGPRKTYDRICEVPLGAIVMHCTDDHRGFVKCEYNGQEGYILKTFLKYTPQYEPAESYAENKLMTRDEVIGDGEIVLEWQEFNVSVVAAYETMTFNKKPWETIRVGCFIDGEPSWGYVEAVEQTGEKSNLKTFMGGSEDEPQVYVYDAEYGLIMIDIMEGVETWTIEKNVCPFGDMAVIQVEQESGNLFTAGSDGPDPIALSPDGEILWRSEIDDPEVYGPLEIELDPEYVIVRYESGKTVHIDYEGRVAEIIDTI